MPWPYEEVQCTFSGCMQWFECKDDLFSHEDDEHSYCFECDIQFASYPYLTQHFVQSPHHAYCQRCRLHLDDDQDLRNHYEDEHAYCGDCNKIFDSEIGLQEHHRQKHADRYCVPCKRMFENGNNLDNHQRSAAHQGRTVQCPMQNCGRSFVSTAALVLHLESGSCPSRLTRDAVNRIVAQIDRSNIITNPSRLIAGTPGSSGDTTVTKTWATERAWNGSCYECYLCHRTYRSLSALNQHLSSPARAEKLYHCPQGWQGCDAAFSTLSAFCQHVEGGSCGVRRFQSEFNRVMGQLSSGAKQLTMGW